MTNQRRVAHRQRWRHGAFFRHRVAPLRNDVPAPKHVWLRKGTSALRSRTDGLRPCLPKSSGRSALSEKAPGRQGVRKLRYHFFWDTIFQNMSAASNPFDKREQLQAMSRTAAHGGWRPSHVGCRGEDAAKVAAPGQPAWSRPVATPRVRTWLSPSGRLACQGLLVKSGHRRPHALGV